MTGRRKTFVAAVAAAALAGGGGVALGAASGDAAPKKAKAPMQIQAPTPAAGIQAPKERHAGDRDCPLDGNVSSADL